MTQQFLRRQNEESTNIAIVVLPDCTGSKTLAILCKHQYFPIKGALFWEVPKQQWHSCAASSSAQKLVGGWCKQVLVTTATIAAQIRYSAPQMVTISSLLPILILFSSSSLSVFSCCPCFLIESFVIYPFFSLIRHVYSLQPWRGRVGYLLDHCYVIFY